MSHVEVVVGSPTLLLYRAFSAHQLINSTLNVTCCVGAHYLHRYDYRS